MIIAVAIITKITIVIRMMIIIVIVITNFLMPCNFDLCFWGSCYWRLKDIYQKLFLCVSDVV